MAGTARRPGRATDRRASRGPSTPGGQKWDAGHGRDRGSSGGRPHPLPAPQLCARPGDGRDVRGPAAAAGGRGADRTPVGAVSHPRDPESRRGRRAHRGEGSHPGRDGARRPSAAQARGAGGAGEGGASAGQRGGGCAHHPRGDPAVRAAATRHDVDARHRLHALGGSDRRPRARATTGARGDGRAGLRAASNGGGAWPRRGGGHGPLNHFVPAPPRPPSDGL